MSTTPHSGTNTAVEECRPTDATPVSIDAESIADATREDLRTFARDLTAEGYVPAEVAATACFSEDCSLATQEEADRLRDLVNAAAFLGANRLTVTVDDVTSPEKVRPAIDALRERADREGVALDVDGLSLD
ncbi:hypothetical protein [Halobacterium zhouii]|uniref:hypothetical protein n=1 Tax=Halobacterium zhouii TaxID=2902624 RepID=UPI001E48AF30|nr:hypothetical protein [Halobacterium zhouii]